MENKDNSEFEFGESKHRWNDWFPLASELHSTFVHFKGHSLVVGEAKDLIRKWISEPRYSESRTPLWSIITRSYLRDYGIDLQTITKVDFENKLGDLVRRGLKFEVVKSLDDLAVEVNRSTKDAVDGKGPFEWRKYAEACKIAGHLIYGPNAEVFADKIVIPEQF
ncbi:MAG: hypothetical protein AABX23_01600 [Nanoarchaeota archaeon]